MWRAVFHLPLHLSIPALARPVSPSWKGSGLPQLSVILKPQRSKAVKRRAEEEEEEEEGDDGRTRQGTRGGKIKGADRERMINRDGEYNAERQRVK